MTEPLHHLGHAFHPRPLRQRRPRDHDHGKAERTRSVDFCARAFAPGIAGDNPFDAARAHHLQLTLKSEWPARHDDVGIEWQCALGRVDESQGVGMLRLRAERRDVLPADGKKDARPIFRQGGDGGRDIRNLDPVIVSRLGPRHTLDRDQRRSACRARGSRVAAHFGRKRMGCINDMRNGFAANIVGKSVRAAESTDAGGQWLVGGVAGASAIGVDRFEARPRNCCSEQIGLSRSAQNEGARHG